MKSKFMGTKLHRKWCNHCDAIIDCKWFSTIALHWLKSVTNSIEHLSTVFFLCPNFIFFSSKCTLVLYLLAPWGSFKSTDILSIVPTVRDILMVTVTILFCNTQIYFFYIIYSGVLISWEARAFRIYDLFDNQPVKIFIEHIK